MDTSRYVLISACRNEEEYIDELVENIVRQTLPPLRWIIVDDNSTDATFSRAALCEKKLACLQVERMPTAAARSFTSQVFAARYGCDLVKDLAYDFIGFLDADIRITPTYYESVLGAFRSDPDLGLCGGLVLDRYADRIENRRKGSEEFHVPGGVQLFRRRCFEQIGGYCAIDGGGQDSIADVMAMMHGWKVRVLPELEVIHLRPEGFAKENVFKRGMRWGRKFYLLGYHPLFYLGQCIRRIAWRPVLLGSFFQLLGFIVAALRRESRPVTPDFIRFQRTMQMRRIRHSVLRKPRQSMLCAVTPAEVGKRSE